MDISESLCSLSVRDNEKAAFRYKANWTFGSLWSLKWFFSLLATSSQWTSSTTDVCCDNKQKLCVRRRGQTYSQTHEELQFLSFSSRPSPFCSCIWIFGVGQLRISRHFHPSWSFLKWSRRDFASVCLHQTLASTAVTMPLNVALLNATEWRHSPHFDTKSIRKTITKLYYKRTPTLKHFIALNETVQSHLTAMHVVLAWFPDTKFDIHSVLPGWKMPIYKCIYCI